MSKNMEKSTNKIELTRQQFENLLKLVYLGNWMVNANRDGSSENPHIEKYEAIEDYIFSFAEQFGCGEYVDGEEATKGKFYPTRLFEEETDVQKLIEEYDEETFWDELIDHLGERALFRRYSKDEIKNMSQDERFEKLCEFIDKWADEINEHGIGRLKIVKGD